MAINRQLPHLALGAALVLLGWALQHHLIRHTTEEAAPNESNAMLPLKSSVPTIQTKLSASELSQITERHLFGKVVKPKLMEPKPLEAPKVVEPDFSNLPETRIPLKLSGIAFSPDNKRAFAMIITADGKQADYQAGEPIGKVAKVHVIEEKRVVIERDGNFEALTLPELGASTRGPARPQRARNNRSLPTRPKQKAPVTLRPTPNT